MQHARCVCTRDSYGARMHRNLDCPLHGLNGADPKVKWELTPTDRDFLRTNRIAPDEPEADE